MKTRKLNVENLCKEFGGKAVLSDLAFDLYSHEIVGLVAPKGAGKTTLLKCVGLMMKPDAALIDICGINALQEPDRAVGKIALLAEDPEVFETMTGKENLEVFGMLMQADRQQMKEARAYTRLGYHLWKKVKTYSTGMKQRLGLGIALMKNPEVILLDEPTNGLEPAEAAALWQELEALRQEGMSILVASQDVDELQGFANRIFFLIDGKIVESLAEGAQTESNPRLIKNPT